MFIDASRFSKREWTKIVVCGAILSFLFLFFLLQVVIALVGWNTIWPVCRFPSSIILLDQLVSLCRFCDSLPSE